MTERKFEFIEDCIKKYESLTRPIRATSGSAGYDFFSPDNFVLESGETAIIPTGIKVKLPQNEVLLLVNRSSNPIKKNLILANSIGVIDSDYYNNPDNEGEIGFMFTNIGTEDVIINTGDKLGQGIFTTYFTVDKDIPKSNYRNGGFGSTGK